MLIRMTASGCQHVVWRSGFAHGVEHPMPAEIMVEVASGHGMKAFHPALPPTVIGVDVLHMKRRSTHANALGEVDGFVDHAPVGSVALINRGTIGTQNRLPFQAMADRVINRGGIDGVKRVGQGMPLPIRHDEHADFIVGIAAFFRLASPYTNAA